MKHWAKMDQYNDEFILFSNHLTKPTLISSLFLRLEHMTFFQWFTWRLMEILYVGGTQDVTQFYRQSFFQRLIQINVAFKGLILNLLYDLQTTVAPIFQLEHQNLFWFSLAVKGTAMQIEKALINDRLLVLKVF